LGQRETEDGDRGIALETEELPADSFNRPLDGVLITSEFQVGELDVYPVTGLQLEPDHERGDCVQAPCRFLRGAAVVCRLRGARDGSRSHCRGVHDRDAPTAKAHGPHGGLTAKDPIDGASRDTGEASKFLLSDREPLVGTIGFRRSVKSEQPRQDLLLSRTCQFAHQAPTGSLELQRERFYDQSGERWVLFAQALEIIWTKRESGGFLERGNRRQVF
jgi:hypothetical protein